MTFSEGQILQKMAYVMLSHAEITSGHYKTRNVSDGWGREFTEAQKLDDSLKTMRSHINHLGELVYTLNKAEK